MFIWTIFDLLDTSAYLLLTAQSVAAADANPLVHAIYWLESALAMEGLNHSATSLLKNVGLGHVHLVQNKLLSGIASGLLPAPDHDIFGSLETIAWPKDKE